ncbi:MAG: leucyl aminopeptidase family protein [Rhizobiales bacterium]|nr:leucyl aminopeptidase family protein [Hyphomicrobiales bacterium]NRB14276.1 leucyl aminopeptidase family protein [Hyphomicrobiales bacterium]
MKLLTKSEIKTQPVPVKLLSIDGLENIQAEVPNHAKWLDLNNFTAAEGELAIIQNSSGGIEQVYFGMGAQLTDIFEFSDPFNMAKLKQLPDGVYCLDDKLQNADIAYFAFALAGYKFDRYKKPDHEAASNVQLVVSDDVDLAAILTQVKAVGITRDLVNTPANDLGPEQLAQAVKQVSDEFGATYNELVGDELLDKGFNLIHTVGRAADFAAGRAPRFVELNWQATNADKAAGKDLPQLTLVGKGVVFDTGGLDLKSAAGMLTMKKDMGGAANVIGLAHMIMAANLPVKLTLLVGAVENSVAANAYRPSDVLKSYHGISIEIGNTDAEGRLVLADLLAYADEKSPDLLIDMATLTGAARVAVGPEIAAYFTDDDELSALLNAHSAKVFDPIWQMPLHKPYLKTMNSRVADMNNISSMPLAGATTAALFLKCFVKDAKSYIHWDINSWNITDRPARPIGGDAQGIRAIFSMLKQKYT